MSANIHIACHHWQPDREYTGRCSLRPATAGGERPLRSWCAHHCPHHSPARLVQIPPTSRRAPAQTRPTADLSKIGPELWADLHRWALTADLTAARAWLERFAARVPCGDCRRHWTTATHENPPPLTSRGELFAWTVARHNQVNRRLGKREMAVVEARQRWDEHSETPGDLENFFDAVWCINLDADVQRWTDFQLRLSKCNWPFAAVTRFSAIHGDTVGVPDYFHQGGGAWGCLQSHRRVLELSLMAGHRRILVLEDDADFRPGFDATFKKFLDDLGGEPWDCLMLGGQHMAPPRPFKPGVVKAADIQRTHCMAFSRSFVRELYRHWSGPLDQHCDWSLGKFAVRFKTFAPERFIAGQCGGPSRITGTGKPPEWWNPPHADAPVVWLRSPRQVIDGCRDIFHAGYQRNADGVCLGLAEAFNAKKYPSERQRIAALRSWIGMIQWEVESRGDGSVCTIWCPAADAMVVKAAAGEMLTEVEAGTVEEGRRFAFSLVKNCVR